MTDQDDEHAALHHEQEQQRWWELPEDSEVWKRHREQLEELRGLFKCP